ncbi:MAG: response regulator [Candidatus Rokuibacteriota bacterium]
MEQPTTTILCVDDEPEILEILTEYFTRQGYQVVTATNGVEAMFQTQRHLPQAIILDLFMPRLGGLGALDRIRRLVPEIVPILISGNPGALEMVTEAGITVAGAYGKPLDLVGMLGALAQAGILPPRKAPAAAEAPAAKTAPSGRRRVLVVDDEPELRAVLVEYLQGKGFEVLQAGGGEEALRRFPEFRPHIVLLDIMMPGLSGVETLRRIKTLQPGTAVIMVSAIEDQEAARQTLALGAADYVAKPVDFQYLDSVLQVHLFMTQIEPL